MPRQRSNAQARPPPIASGQIAGGAARSRKTTRSVGDGIPTQSVGTSVIYLHNWKPSSVCNPPVNRCRPALRVGLTVRAATRPRPTARNTPQPRPEAARQRQPFLHDRRAEPAGDGVGQQFRSGVRDRQQHALVAREAPEAVAITHAPVAPSSSRWMQRAARRQQHPMIEFIRDGSGHVPQGNEIEHVMVLIQVVFTATATR